MNGPKIALLCYVGLQALFMVSRVGKPRPTYTPHMAAIGLVEYGAVAWLVLAT